MSAIVITLGLVAIITTAYTSWTNSPYCVAKPQKIAALRRVDIMTFTLL